jgi:outer membrane lipoprotein-sorting protein
MRRFKFITAILFLFSLAVSAQTVDEIVAKHIAAQGGLAKLKAVRSIRMTGSFEAGGVQAMFTQLYKRPMKTRLDVEVQGMTMTQAYDGQNGWQVVPFTGKKDPEPMSGDPLKNMKEQADIDGPLLDYKAKGSTVVLVGKENIDGADAYHLKVTLKDGSVREMYLDARTYLVSRIVVKTKMQGAEVELESNATDYRQVDGLMFPFSIEQHATAGNGPGQKIIFRTVEVNPTVADSSFKMPAAAPAPDNKTAPSPK